MCYRSARNESEEPELQSNALAHGFDGDTTRLLSDMKSDTSNPAHVEPEQRQILTVRIRQESSSQELSSPTETLAFHLRKGYVRDSS
jgi:hypothetical protein